ncbi:MAG: hypothetical protein JXR77_05995 [Lentisphaeria bacterium]|nr:hypothetical protein [Lentisphaeria bacterium]
MTTEKDHTLFAASGLYTLFPSPRPFFFITFLFRFTSDGARQRGARRDLGTKT